MPAPDADARLVAAVGAFADELNGLIAGVVPGGFDPFVARAAEGRTTLVIVDQGLSKGVSLVAGGEPLLRLTASYRCQWDHTSEFLAVKQSEFALTTEGSEEPLFRYDFDADCDGKVPAAHLNVHGHRDEIVFALMGSGHRLRGKTRSVSMVKGQIPRLATFHFPLGGHRFRPSLEDVLEIAVREFGIDTRPGWDAHVKAGRASWRDKQLRAAVRDDPETAADALRHLGYAVERSDDAPAPQRRDERVLAL